MEWLPQLIAVVLWPIYIVAALIGAAVLGVSVIAVGALIETTRDHRDGHGSA